MLPPTTLHRQSDTHLFQREGQEKRSQSRVSQIFISDKARQSTNSETLLPTITRENDNLEKSSKAPSTLPYIAILVDLGQPAALKATFYAKGDNGPCLCIYAAGADTSTYDFLKGCSALQNILCKLVKMQQIPDTQRPHSEALDVQVNVGQSATPKHMEWEHT